MSQSIFAYDLEGNCKEKKIPKMKSKYKPVKDIINDMSKLSIWQKIKYLKTWNLYSVELLNADSTYLTK